MIGANYENVWKSLMGPKSNTKKMNTIWVLISNFSIINRDKYPDPQIKERLIGNNKQKNQTVKDEMVNNKVIGVNLDFFESVNSKGISFNSKHNPHKSVYYPQFHIKYNRQKRKL